MDVTIEYSGKLPSINHMYGRNKWGGMYLKSPGVALKKAVVLSTKGKLPVDVEVGYELVVYGNWYNKSEKAKTRIKKRDSNNLVKLIVDACCDALGIDDSQIFREQVVKEQGEEGFRVRFYVCSIFTTL